MTRKDYIVIARALAESRPVDDGTYAFEPGATVEAIALDEWRNVRGHIRTALRADNPAFDDERFVLATEG